MIEILAEATLTGAIQGAVAMLGLVVMGIAGYATVVRIRGNGKPETPSAERISVDAVGRVKIEGLEIRADAADAARTRIFQELEGIGNAVAATGAEVRMVRETQTTHAEALGNVAAGVSEIKGFLKGRDDLQ